MKKVELSSKKKKKRRRKLNERFYKCLIFIFMLGIIILLVDGFAFIPFFHILCTMKVKVLCLR